MGRTGVEKKKVRGSTQVDRMNPDEFASLIIDLCTQFDIVRDYSLDIYENVIVKSRIYLDEGFVQVFRNFDSQKIAFAWLIDEERVYGADNTGGWHVHPYENPSRHVVSSPVELDEFLENVEIILTKRKEDEFR